MKKLLIAALLVLAACGRGPRLDPLGPNDVVLAFGDSLTFGTGAAPGESYPAQLATLINRKVVNAGVPGEISADGLARLPDVLEETQPKLLILCHGGNDFLRKLGDAKAAENVRAMIRLAQSKNIRVMLIATPKPGLSLSAPPFYAEIAKDMKLPLEESTIADVLGSNAKKSDLVHPNAQGYREIAEAVAKVLKKAGAV